MDRRPVGAARLHPRLVQCALPHLCFPAAHHAAGAHGLARTDGYPDRGRAGHRIPPGRQMRQPDGTRCTPAAFGGAEPHRDTSSRPGTRYRDPPASSSPPSIMRADLMAGQAAPVLIVGAGPTGLTLANALVRQGVRVVTAERNAVPCRDSKALAINVASQYGFQTIGMEDAAGRGGNLLVRAGVYWQNKRLTGIDLRRLDDGCARVIVQPQADTERELIAALAACGQAVHWNTTVTALVPHADGTTTTLAGPDGDTVHEFAYVVGCDGKHSLVRRQMGASFDGPDYPFHFVLGDFTLRWDAPVDQARYYADENGFFIMVPLGAKSWRVVVKRDGPMPQGRPDPAMITAPVRAHLGEVFLDDAPTWLSSAPCYSRTSDRLRAGRLLLAGDAAHLFTAGRHGNEHRHPGCAQSRMAASAAPARHGGRQPARRLRGCTLGNDRRQRA